MVCQRDRKREFNKGSIMANRNNVLEKFSSKYKKQRRFGDESGNGGHKKQRPNWDSQRKAKNAQWEEQEDER